MLLLFFDRVAGPIGGGGGGGGSGTGGLTNWGRGGGLLLALQIEWGEQGWGEQQGGTYQLGERGQLVLQTECEQGLGRSV